MAYIEAIKVCQEFSGFHLPIAFSYLNVQALSQFEIQFQERSRLIKL